MIMSKVFTGDKTVSRETVLSPVKIYGILIFIVRNSYEWRYMCPDIPECGPQISYGGKTHSRGAEMGKK